ncbi:MAG: hypothetical protein ACOYMZ_02285, partial [Minisyncoccia bacterium]
ARAKKSAVHSSRTLLHGGIRIWQKEISLGFANPFPQNCFAKPSPHLYSCFRPFPFGKALCFAQRRFSATDARLVFARIVLEKS